MGRPGRNPCSIASIESDTPSRHGETRKREQRGHEGYSVEPWPALDHHAIEPRAERCNYGEVLRDAASDSGRQMALRAVTGQPLDHPELLTVPETGYLKGVVLEAMD